MMQDDTLEQLSIDELESIFPKFRSQIERGLSDARAGRLSDGDAFFDQLEREDRGVERRRRRTA